MQSKKWNYFKENLTSSRVVATFINQNGICIFEVYEGEYGFIATSDLCQLNLSKINTITYSETKKNINTIKNETALDRLFEKLIISCEYFENQYNKQVEEMHNLFMNNE